MDDRNPSAAPLLVERAGAVETLVSNDAQRNRMSLDFIDALECEVQRPANDSSVVSQDVVPQAFAILLKGGGSPRPAWSLR